MMHTQLSMKQLSVPKLFDTVTHLSGKGHLKMNAFGLTYLDIDDNYIHQIFPLIPDMSAMKPEYFGENLVGAHISVIYPEEEICSYKADLNKEHYFTIIGLFSATIENKKYYFLKVKAPTLVSLRRRHGLSDKLSFKNYWIDLHITVGVVC
jgi:hypothetical protein